METKYFGYRFLSVKITASCLRIWFADIRLWFQQTKHLQCMQIFPKLKTPQKNAYLHKQFQPTVYSVVIIPLLPVHRTIENFSVELMLLLLLCSSISFRHTTHRRFCLGSLSTISLYHAKYVILTLMLATPYALVCSPCAGMIVVGLWSLKFGVH